MIYITEAVALVIDKSFSKYPLTDENMEGLTIPENPNS